MNTILKQAEALADAMLMLKEHRDAIKKYRDMLRVWKRIADYFNGDKADRCTSDDKTAAKEALRRVQAYDKMQDELVNAASNRRKLNGWLRQIHEVHSRDGKTKKDLEEKLRLIKKVLDSAGIDDLPY